LAPVLVNPINISYGTALTTVTDAGGSYTGSPFPATAANATGAGGLSDATLTDFTFSYSGTGSTTYSASSTAATNAGTYSVSATYKGDANHNFSSSTPLAFTIISQAAPSITASAGATDVIGSNTPLGVSATLGGAINPTGSITFTLYSPANTVVFSNIVKVTANGTYSSTASGTTTGSAVPTVAGTYQWVVSYSGDANNKPAATTKGVTPETAVGGGDNPLIGGLGAHKILAGNGSNILIDGNVQLTSATDTFQSVLSAWVTGVSSPTNLANIRSRLKVNYNTTNTDTVQAGSGPDWFWYTDIKDSVNRKATDLLN
jgi:hypothetical protein